MTTPANFPSGSTVGQPWADNMSLTSLGTAMSTDTTTAVALQQAVDTQRFWSTPERPATSLTQEVMQVTLTSARLVNEVIFDVAIFPQIIAVEYYDEAAGAWTPCLDKLSTGSVPVHQTINTSYPLVLPPITNVTGHVHPQHSFSGHWQTLEFAIQPISARLFRVLLQRTTNGAAPTNVFGALVDYSLAIRNFYIGYSVQSFADAPIASPVNGALTANGSFASTTDLLGSTVDFTMQINSAENVLRNDASVTNVIWKCEPQPFPWAVVNFYVDTRDTNGAAQVIDRFFLEPLYTGPTVHIYYSNDTIIEAYAGTVEPLTYPIAQVFDPDGVGGDVLHSGLAGLGATAFVTIDNQVLSFDPGRSWWVGASVNFKIEHGTENFDSPIFDCGAFQIFLTPFGIACQTQYGDTLAMDIDDFDPATTLNLVVAYDGVDTLSINALSGAVNYQESMPLPVPLVGTSVSTLSVGGFLGSNPSINWFDFNDFVLKTDDVPSATTIADFLATPDAYVQLANFAAQTDPRTNNALLRYHPGWATNDVPSGFIGGEPNHYDVMTWAPIARDYTLTKGNYDIPATKAKFWKFEFTGLIPEPYEVYKPITSSVKTFSTSMVGVSTISKTFPITPQTTVGAQLAKTFMVNNMVTAVFDNGTFTQTGTGAANLGLAPTQARVIYDNGSRSIVGTAYWAWNFLPVHSGTSAPSFTSTGQHIYEQVNVTQSSKIAYFVGLVSVQAFRLDALATDDTVRYVDNFYDMTNIAEDTNWTLLGDHQLTSGASKYAVLQSQPFSSTRIVTGVQFADQQSDPIQMLQDPDFDDPTHANWTSVGDATLAPGIVVDTTVGNTIQVSRASVPNNWNAVMAGYPEWHNITDLNLSWAQVVTSAQNPELQGGITSPAVATPAGGRISVAARVIAPADLVSPLWVQIVDDQTGQVVSEEQINVKGHQVTEWYTSFTIGDVVIAPWRWSDFFTSPVIANFLSSFDTTNGRPLPVMDTGQLWSSDLNGIGASLSESIVANTAEVTTEGQYNYVDVKQPWGTLEFKVGAMGNSQTLLNLLLNGNFPGTVSGWTAINSPTAATQAATGGLDGQTTYLLVTSTNASTDTGYQQTVLNVIAGMTYRFSTEAMGSVTAHPFSLSVQWFNSSNALISTTTSALTSNPVWNSYDTYHLAPAAAVKAVVFVDMGVMAIGSTFRFTNAYFQFGTQGADDVNMTLNPTFEVNTTGWTTVGGATLARVAGGSQGSGFSAQVKSVSVTVDTALFSSNIPNIVAGTTYEFSADVNPSRNTVMNLQVDWLNNVGTVLSQPLNTFTLTAGTFQRLVFNFTAPATAVTALLIVDGGLMPVNATFNVDNVFFGYRTERMLVSFEPFMLDDQGILSDNSGTPLPTAYETNVLTTSNTARAVQANDDIRIDILPTYLVTAGRTDIAHSSNADPLVWPYSLMFFLNGTWMRTVSHDLGALTLRYIKGRLHQQFASWNWTPFPYGALPGTVLRYLPRLDKGQWLDPLTFTQFQDVDDNTWNATGSWDLSTPPEFPLQDNYGAPLTVAQSGSTFTTDVGIWYGSMSAYVRNVASGVPGTTHGDVLVLDAGNGVTLNAAGNVMFNGTSFGNLIPGGIPNNAMLTVTWARSSQISATSRGTVNPTTFPDMLIGKVNGQIVGRFASTMLTQWRGTHRGLAGDIYDPTGGSRPTAANYTLDTSFRAFHWAPDASLVPQNPAKPTWNDVTGYSTVTYDQATRGRGLTEPLLRAQVIQFGQSQDVWDIDNLSMFVDPIVWSFSNDGGFTFYPAYDIRNNPNGVLAFPSSTVVTSIGRTPGTSLIWRATSYAVDRVISSLVIRPWYAGLLSGITQRVGVGMSGPNLMPNDQTPPLNQDPAFQVWSNPIPQPWWYQFRLVQRAQAATQAAMQGD